MEKTATEGVTEYVPTAVGAVVDDAYVVPLIPT